MSITDIRDGKVLAGVEQLAYTIATSMGPFGRKCLLDKSYGIISDSDDGFEISKVVNFSDDNENKGAMLLREAAFKTHERVGDGCSAAVCMANEIIKEEVKNIQAGASPIMLGNGLKKAFAVCDAYLRELSSEDNGPEILRKVAVTAAKDEKLISEVEDIFQEVHKGKIVTIEESQDSIISVEKLSGMLVENGYSSPYFVKDMAGGELTYEDVYILLTENVISDFYDLIPIIEHVEAADGTLLILSAGVAGEALSNLLLNVHKRGLKAVAVTAGGYGISGSEVLEDAAIYTGGKVIAANDWEYFKSDFSYLGRAAKVKTTHNSTIIFGGNGKKEAVNKYISLLEGYCNEEDSKAKRLAYRTRMSRLSDERIIIKVGGKTAYECQEKKNRYEKAFSSVHAAYRSGVLPGGGVAYLRCVPKLMELASELSDDERTGVLLLAKALEAPAYHIIKNAGLSGERIVEELKDKDLWVGYDVNNNCFCDMSESGILDAAEVVSEAIGNAVSVASVFLNAKAFVDKNSDKNK